MRFAKGLRRSLRPAAKTLQAIARWRRLSFSQAPAIFGNGKPKSGSHLLLQILAGFTEILPYAYVASDPIRTITREGRRRSAVEILDDLKRIPRGVIGWGYVEPTAENIAYLCGPGRVNYFLYRDPRDMLVSHVFFATDMDGDHGMHAYYQTLPDLGARLKVAITGIQRDGLRMVSVKERYAGVFKWLDQKHVLCLRYEDLVERRGEAFDAMLNQVESTGYRVPTPRPRAISILERSIRPDASRTFREGKAGGWRQYFTAEHKRLFVDVAGDLLVRLGYEKGNDW